MGVFDNFTGGKSRDDIAGGKARSNALLTEGYGAAKDAYGQYYDQAQGYYQPYAQGGQRANVLYSDALGINGADARQAFLSNYTGNDAFLEHDRNRAVRDVQRRFNSQGNTGGAAMLAASRASMDVGNTYRNQHLDRLAGLQGQGLAVAGAQSGLAMGQGDRIGGLEYGYRNQLAGNEISAANAMAGTRSAGINNFFNAVGTAANLIGSVTGGQGLTGGKPPGKGG